MGTKSHISINYFVEVLRLNLMVQQSADVSMSALARKSAHLKRTSYRPLKQIRHFPGSQIPGVNDSSFHVLTCVDIVYDQPLELI